MRPGRRGSGVIGRLWREMGGTGGVPEANRRRTGGLTRPRRGFRQRQAGILFTYSPLTLTTVERPEAKTLWPNAHYVEPV